MKIKEIHMKIIAIGLIPVFLVLAFALPNTASTAILSGGIMITAFVATFIGISMQKKEAKEPDDLLAIPPKYCRVDPGTECQKRPAGGTRTMKTIIYYFTGTGNSLAVAKKIAAALNDCELVPIASLQKTTGNIVPQAERIGIVCPVYFSGLPLMVAAFAGRLDLSGVQYIFAVITHGGGGGETAIRQLDGILRKRSGHGLDAGYPVTMPGNYILMYSSPAGEKKEEILAKADEQIAGITGPVSQCEKRALPSSLITRLLHTLLYPWFTSHVHTDDKKFTVNDKCTACGTCAAICPANNIELVEGKPVWKHHCELCCGCIHLCPEGAIQAGKGTEARVRYRNPSVTIAELKRRS